MKPNYMKQFDRVKRFYCRILDSDRDQMYYEDDLWAFFQNCWHLKDWIKNDETVSCEIFCSIEEAIKEYKYIMICSDLANRSKHSKLYIELLDTRKPKKGREEKPRAGAEHRADNIIDLNVAKAKYEYYIVVKGGEHVQLKHKTTYRLSDIAEKAIKNWETYMRKNGLLEQ